MPLCSKCGAELDESAKFCMECGTPVLQTKKCKKCGSELPSKAKFCFNCGTAQEESTFNKDPSDSETNAAELKTTKNGDVSVREKENSFTDPRDGETYKVCRIGEQIWMAENLRYRPLKGGSYPYNRDKDNVVKYGRLYEEKAIEEAIPPGWHLPEENEIEQMKAFIKKTYHIADALRSKDWDDGMDVYGFNAIPSGYYGHNYQDNLGFFNDCATYWLTSFSKRKNKWITGTFSIYHDDAYNWNNQSGYEDEDGNWISYSEKYACSIRCIKDYYHEKQKEPEDFFSKIKDIFGDASSQDKTTMASAKSTPKGHDVSVKASLNAEMGEMEMGEIKVKEGDFVSINQEVAVIMYGNGFFKNQSKPLLAPCNGMVKSILVKQYNDLTEGQIIMIITE